MPLVAVVSQWLKSVRRDGRGRAPIPTASVDQAALEALVLERIGDWAPVFWSPDIPAFGIAWVDSSPGDLTMAIPVRYLPDIARSGDPH